MSKRRALVWELAPVAPPCFAARSAWLEFLASAAEAQAARPQPVLLIQAGQPVRFNPRFNFCADCDRKHKRAMKAADKCRPEWLADKETSHAA